MLVPSLPKSGAGVAGPQASEKTSAHSCTEYMQAENYKGYSIWGHAILQQMDILEPERYAASGTITQHTKVIETSGILGSFKTDEDARQAGLAWARAWVDSHG